MNGMFNHRMLFSLILITFAPLWGGCDNNSTNPGDAQFKGVRTSGARISDHRNIIWTLDQSGYERLYLIFDEEQFFGYEGCNWFGGWYEARGDSIIPRDVAQTERGCDVRTFPVQYLMFPFLVTIDEDELLLSTRNGAFTLTSDLTESIENSPLIEEWQLTASTDPQFADLKARQLLPSLTLAENREFKISWYCSSDNLMGCDEIYGIFGIGTDDKIFFYKTGWKNHSAGLDFVGRILDSSAFSVETKSTRTLTLVNKETRASYVFSPVD
jgi:hypothetical protein